MEHNNSFALDGPSTPHFALQDVRYTEWRRLNLTVTLIKHVALSPAYLLYSIISRMTALVSGVFAALQKSSQQKPSLIELEELQDVLPSSSKEWQFSKFNRIPLHERGIRFANEIASYAEAYQSCMNHYEAYYKEDFDPNDEKKYIAKINNEIEKLKGIVARNKSGADACLNKIKHHFKACLVEVVSKVNDDSKTKVIKYFEKECTICRADRAPSILCHDLNKHLMEDCKQLDLGYGAAYLEARKEVKKYDYWQETSYLKNHPFRISSQKLEEDVQGMTMNGHAHVIYKRKEKVASIFRSGAFTVRGRKEARLDTLSRIGIAKKHELVRHSESVGTYTLSRKLDKLKKWEKEGNQADINRLLKRLGFESIEELRSEMIYCRDLLIAQALPKIVRSLETITQDPKALEIAKDTGSFLHVEEGLLSHCDPSEKEMMKDMKLVMDYLSKYGTVKLDASASQPKVHVAYSEDEDSPKINIILPHENAEDDEKYGLTALYFNTGINEMQTFGDLFFPYDPAQDKINTDSLNALHAYLERCPDPEVTIKGSLLSLKYHYSSKGERAAKDMEGLRIRLNAVKDAHGGRGVVCKSGKDRTALLVSQILAEEAVIATECKVNAKEMQRKLQAGISHRLTGINTGKPDAYAFNWFQRRCLPNALVPPAKLCGSVEG